jgi:acetyl-CoA synthetase
MTAEGYAAALARVERDPDAYWMELAGRLDWIRKPSRTKDVSFNREDFHVRWYEDGVLNVSVNCLDRHIAQRGDQVALIWEPDDGENGTTLTYRQLLSEVCRMANVLKSGSPSTCP